MEALLKTKILVGLLEAASIAHQSSKRAGNWEQERDFPSVLHALSIQLEKASLATQSPSEKLNEVSVFEEHLADLLIVLLDIAIGKNLLLISAVIQKLEYNEAKSKVVQNV